MAAVVNGLMQQLHILANSRPAEAAAVQAAHLCAKGLHGTCTCCQDAGHLRLAQLLPGAVVGHGHHRAVVHRPKAHQLQRKPLHMSTQQVGTFVSMERISTYVVVQLIMVAFCCRRVLRCVVHRLCGWLTGSCV